MSEHRTNRRVELGQLGAELAAALGRADPVPLSSRTEGGRTTVQAPRDVPADRLAAVVDAHAAPEPAPDPDRQLVDRLRSATSWEAVRDLVAADVERRGVRPAGPGRP